jgi:hypothetical protein
MSGGGQQHTRPSPRPPSSGPLAQHCFRQMKAIGTQGQGEARITGNKNAIVLFPAD